MLAWVRTKFQVGAGWVRRRINGNIKEKKKHKNFEDSRWPHSLSRSIITRAGQYFEYPVLERYLKYKYPVLKSTSSIIKYTEKKVWALHRYYD